jgi:hypothetical protein
MNPINHKTIPLLMLFLLVLATILGAETRTYTETTGDRIVTHQFNIQPNTSGIIVQLETKTGENVIKQLFRLDSKMASQAWEYHDPLDNTKLSAMRKGNIIILEGRDRGKSLKKTFEINDLPWNQTFNIGLEPFAMTSDKKMKFWAIGVKGPGNMKITKFTVKRKKVETITLSKWEKPIESHHITISLSGLLSIFWTGKYWYRKSDGVFLQYKGKNKRGAPISTMELIAKE